MAPRSSSSTSPCGSPCDQFGDNHRNCGSQIPQGSNNPLVIQFDTVVDNIPKLVVTLWCDKVGYSNNPIKVWNTEDMTISGDTAICPMSEDETKALPNAPLILEAKGLDVQDNTIFWDEYPIDVKRRRDKIITLTQSGG